MHQHIDYYHRHCQLHADSWSLATAHTASVHSMCIYIYTLHSLTPIEPLRSLDDQLVNIKTPHMCNFSAVCWVHCNCMYDEIHCMFSGLHICTPTAASRIWVTIQLSMIAVHIGILISCVYQRWLSAWLVVCCIYVHGIKPTKLTIIACQVACHALMHEP